MYGFQVVASTKNQGLPCNLFSKQKQNSHPNGLSDTRTAYLEVIEHIIGIDNGGFTRMLIVYPGIICITDKQFGQMDIFSGRKRVIERNTPQQLELF